MKTPITDHALAGAIVQLSLMPFFPAESLQQRAVAMFLRQLVNTTEELNWLVSTLVNRVPKWPGPMGVRGVFCTRFKPADGIEADSDLPGFTPSDGEMRSVIANQNRPLLSSGEANQLLRSLNPDFKIKEIGASPTVRVKNLPQGTS